MTKSRTPDPEAAKLLERARASTIPPYETLSPAKAREYNAMGRPHLQPPKPDMGLIEDIDAGGITVRNYRPFGSDAAAVLPAMVYFHGGGWVLGDLDSHDIVCRSVCNASGGAVLSVNYRVAPEARFPAAVEDAFTATHWIAGYAAKLNIDATRLAIGGDSAGGNLAAVVALLARDAGGPRLIHQALTYPATDMMMETPSHTEFADGHILTRSVMNWFHQQYFADPAQKLDWRASPLRAPSLAGLPPASILLAGCDPLRDEGHAYAERLRQAGVQVAVKEFPGTIHSFIGMGKVLPQAAPALNWLGSELRLAYARP